MCSRHSARRYKLKNKIHVCCTESISNGEIVGCALLLDILPYDIALVFYVNGILMIEFQAIISQNLIQIIMTYLQCRTVQF